MGIRIPLRLLPDISALFVVLTLFGAHDMTLSASGPAVEATLPATTTLAADAPNPLQEAGRWEWYSGGTFEDVYSPDGVQVWAAGNGVWHSTNSGATWTRIPIYGTTTLEHIRMSAQGRGFVIGSQPKVHRTEDAGTSWQLTRDNPDPQGLVEVSDPNTLIVTRQRAYDNEVSVSWDGGASWASHILSSNPPDSIVAYLDTAWLFHSLPYDHECLTFVTTDRGNTWECRELVVQGNDAYGTDAAFGSATHGWLLGKYKDTNAAFVWRTTDGGISWVTQKSVGSISGWVQALDANTGWVWDDGYLWRTTDGGTTWQGIGYGTPKRAHFRTLNEGWGINEDRIVRTVDSGRTWSTVFTLPTRQQEWFLNHLIGWRANDSIIERTTDGGGTWTGADTDLAGIDEYRFVDARNGWAWHHDSRSLAHTTNGGASWVRQSPGTDTFRLLQFANAYAGWVTDSTNRLRRTTDGGTSWHDVTTPPLPAATNPAWPTRIEEVFFSDSLYGWASVNDCWPSGRSVQCDIYQQTRTTDGGLTWGPLTPGPQKELIFLNRLNGWALDHYCDALGCFSFFNSTIDGGLTWTAPADQDSKGDLSWLRVKAADRLWIGGWGEVQFSSDGGVTWMAQRMEQLIKEPMFFDGTMQTFAGKSRYRNTEIVAYRAAQAPMINASLEDWSGVPAYSLKQANSLVVDGIHPVPLDSSATLQAAWDNSYLYFAVQSYDNRLTVDSPSNPWHDDAVELGLDGAHDHIRRWDLGSASDDWQFTIDAQGNTYESGAPTTAIRAASTITANGYILELAVPRTQIGPQALTVGRLIGFNYAIIDDDDGGNRDSRLVWLDASTYAANAAWGQLRLGSIAAPFYSLPPTLTPTSTSAATATSALTPASTWTSTPTATLTATSTATSTPTPTTTETSAPTATGTSTPTSTETQTPALTVTATQTPTPSATPSPPITATSIATPVLPGRIGGVVWYDRNGDGVPQINEPRLEGVAIRLYLGDTQVGQTTTVNGVYYFPTLTPERIYRVSEVQPPWLHFSSTPDEVVVALYNGEVATINFGDWSGKLVWLPLVLRS